MFVCDSIQAGYVSCTGGADPDAEESLPDRPSAMVLPPWEGMTGLLQFLDADDVRLNSNPDPYSNLNANFAPLP